MPKSTTSTPGGSARRGEPVGERDAEAVVAEEDVADPGDEDAPGGRGGGRVGGQRLDLGGGEEEAMAEAAGGAEVAPGVVLDGDHQVDGALRVLLDRVHEGDPAVQRDVEHVGPLPRAQADAAAAPDLHAVDLDGIGPEALERLPAAHRRAIPNSRTAPCRRMQLLLGEALRALEDLARPRVGVPHLGLLRVREGEDVQHEQLVDLAAVEQVARALGGDARMVLEDDRRGENGVAVPGLADQDGPAALVAAGLGGGSQVLRAGR